MFGGIKSYGNKVLEPFQTLADNTKAQKKLGWNPKWTVQKFLDKHGFEVKL